MAMDYKETYARSNLLRLKSDPKVIAAYNRYMKQVKRMGAKSVHSMDSFVKSGAYRNYIGPLSRRAKSESLLGAYGRRSGGTRISDIMEGIDRGEY